MIKFDDRYFSDFIFTKEQVKRNFENAMKDLKIARAPAVVVRAGRRDAELGVKN